ncbi:MAG: energy transducer TonB [Muribaculaceae bacterium]|nr:energy transducer TonB [Muribaculaceae bacterium]
MIKRIKHGFPAVGMFPGWLPAVAVAFALANATPLCAADTSAQIPATPEQIYVAVEQQPEFPGGISSLMQWVASHLRYPEAMVRDNIQGRPIVKFVVGTDGKVRDAQIVKGICPEGDAEAVRVVMAMPDWIPGKKDGRAVPCYYNLPITFRIQTPPAEKEPEVLKNPFD